MYHLSLLPSFPLKYTKTFVAVPVCYSLTLLDGWPVQRFIFQGEYTVCGVSIVQPRVLDYMALLWRHNGHHGVSNHQPHECLLNRLFKRRSKKTSKLRVTGLCVGNSPGTGEFPAQMASNAEKISIWWRHHGTLIYLYGWKLVKFCELQYSPKWYDFIWLFLYASLSFSSSSFDLCDLNLYLHADIWRR